MNIKLVFFGKRFSVVVLGLSVLFVLSRSALAVPTGPLGCGGVFGVGGCPPYGQLSYGTGGNDGSLYEYDEVVLSQTITGPTASVSGVVDMVNGQLKVFAQGIEDGDVSTASGGYISASATDVFTLTGAGSGLVDFSVIFTADGTASIANLGYIAQAILQLGVPGGGGGQFDRGVYQSGTNVALGTPFSLFSTIPSNMGNPFTATDTYTVSLNTPFSMSYSLRADVQQGSIVDISNTAYLNFILPAGVSLTSMGGYSVSAVPLPAAIWLFASGMLGLLGITKCKNYKAIYSRYRRDRGDRAIIRQNSPVTFLINRFVNRHIIVF